MNIKRNYYKILGIEPDSDETQIKAAYKNLVKRWHPDLNNNSIESRQMMKDINEAYEVLSDEKMRIEYNRVVFGSAFAKQGSPKTSSYHSPTKEERERVKKRYENKYNDAQSYYSDFEKNMREGAKDNCSGSVFDKFHVLYADSSYLPYGMNFCMIPVLIVFAVFWHGIDMVGRVFAAFFDLFVPDNR